MKGVPAVALGARLDIHTLRRVLHARLGVAPRGHLDGRAATGVAFDDRRVRPGDAFFALAGVHAHGIAYADAAIAHGAAYVVSDRPHPRGLLVDDPAAALLALGSEARAAWSAPVVAVSGSVGKTTMRSLLAASLDARAGEGNRNTPLALAATLVDGWLEGDTRRPLVLELGIDHVGEMDVLAELVAPSHALLTSIAAAHLEGLGDLAGVAREKSRLLERASEGRYAAAGAWQHLSEELRAATVRYGLDEPAPPTGRHLAHGAAGDELEARLDDGDAPIVARLPGIGAAVAEHALGALVVARDLGVAPRTAAERLTAARLEGRRLQATRLGDLTLLDDSYNASPTSMRLALEVLRGLPAPHAAVLGDMLELGPHAAGLHAELASRCGDIEPLWAVGPESAILAAGRPGAHHFPDVEAALPHVDELPRRGTLLVKASRGVGLDRLVDALVLRRSVAPARADPEAAR